MTTFVAVCSVVFSKISIHSVYKLVNTLKPVSDPVAFKCHAWQATYQLCNKNNRFPVNYSLTII